METVDWIAFSITVLIMAIGCVGSVVPFIPGTPLILAAAIIHKIIMGPKSAGWFVLIMLIGIALLSITLDYLASVYGAKRFGATRKGMIGAIVGLIVGLFFNLPGILLGPFIGAGLFELIGGREWKSAMKAGAGATLGLFAGAVGKFICCICMMLLFAASLVWHVWRVT